MPEEAVPQNTTGSNVPAPVLAPAPQVSVEKEKTPLEKLKETTDVLLMLYSKDKEGNFYHSITQEDERGLYNLLSTHTSDKKSLLIYLDTSGGNTYSAVKIMDMLRNKYEHISIGIAEEAKSAGTLMCLAADEIIMSYASELGPLDKPMAHPSNEMATISALDIVRSLDTIIDTALDKQVLLARKFVKAQRISKEKALQIAGDSISKLMSPLLCQEDAKIYNQAVRLLKMAERYGVRFLNKYGLKWIKKEDLRERITSLVMKRLIWEYPDHNFAICRDEAENDLFLSITKAEDTAYWNELWKIFEETIETENKIIKFL